MALPFVLGLALGATAVVAYNKNAKIKEKADEIFKKSKDLACETKKNIDATVDCIKEKAKKTKEDETTNIGEA